MVSTVSLSSRMEPDSGKGEEDVGDFFGSPLLVLRNFSEGPAAYMIEEV